MRDSYTLYMDKLQGEYKETFEQISTYVLSQNIDEDSMETQMGELLDTFFLAQEEEKPVSKITGTDLESFCKNFCSQFGLENKLLNLADKWKNIAWCIFVISALNVSGMLLDFIDGVPVDWFGANSEFNITGYLLGFLGVGLIATLFDFITIKVMFKYPKDCMLMKVFRGIKVVALVGSFLLFYHLYTSDVTDVFHMPIWVLFVASGIYLIAYYRINKERVKERKANKVSFWGMVQKDLEADTDVEFRKQMNKDFQKKSARLAKRGKPELTWEQYLDKAEKDAKACYKFKPLYDWAPLVVAIGLGILEYINNGFNMDLIVYVGWIFLCEFIVLRFLWKFVKNAADTKMIWVETERKKLEEAVK